VPRHLLIGLFAIALLPAALAAATPRTPGAAVRRAMCRASAPPGMAVRCRSARVSGADPRWGKTVHTYRGGGSGSSQRRTGWVRRRARSAKRWTLEAAVTGPDRAPCGQVPLRVLRDFYGTGACR
jgi:hypothetical protein